MLIGSKDSEEKPVDAAVAAGPTADPKDDPKQEPAMDRPLLGIDNLGNLTLFIPLPNIGEVFARGFIDVCRTQAIQWYANQAQKRREIANLAAKTGFQRFRDQLLRRK